MFFFLHWTAILATGSPTKHFTRVCVTFFFLFFTIWFCFCELILMFCLFGFVYCSIKPFSQQPYGGKPATAISGEIDAGHPSAQASWEGRAIATSKFRLLEFSAFMEVQREEVVSGKYTWHDFEPFSKEIVFLFIENVFLSPSNVKIFHLLTLLIFLYSQYRHLFVHINGKTSYSDPLLEVNHLQIYLHFILYQLILFYLFSVRAVSEHQRNQRQIPRKIGRIERTIRKRTTECILLSKMLGWLEHKHYRWSRSILCCHQPVSRLSICLFILREFANLNIFNFAWDFNSVSSIHPICYWALQISSDVIHKSNSLNFNLFTFPFLRRYESNENIVITCSTKVCSFGKQVVEKVETEYSRLESSRFIYRIQRSPMCEYMINFIQKLKGLPERYMMNSVLENFTILQVRIGREFFFHSTFNHYWTCTWESAHSLSWEWL